MAVVLVKELIAAGMHFGHRTSRWNPKMAPYIFGKRNLIHIINLKETIRGLVLASRFLAQVATRGEYVLFVGTKRQAKTSIERIAKEIGCPYVAERWLGGCLTNFRTVRSRLTRLLELERLEASGEINNYSKKVIASLRREKHKMLRNLDGIRTLDRLPGALVVIDPRHEIIAIREALKLGIPTVALMDTDSDPDLVTLPVPGNDDAIRSIEIFLRHMAEAVQAGKAKRAAMPADQRPRIPSPREAVGPDRSEDRRGGDRGHPGGRGRGGPLRGGRSDGRPGGARRGDGRPSGSGRAAQPPDRPAERPTSQPAPQAPPAPAPAPAPAAEVTAPKEDASS